MKPKTLIIGGVAYRVFPIEGGRRLRAWAPIGTKRKAVTATTEERLKKKLRKISADLRDGQIEAANLDGRDHRELLAAREVLKPHRVSVEFACREYAHAKEILGATRCPSGSDLADAARFYQRHGERLATAATVSEVIDDYRPTLAGASYDYRRMVRGDLERLRADLGSVPIGEVSTRDLERFVDRHWSTASDWRRKQVRGSLLTLWNFARRRRFLPPFPTAAQDLPRVEPLNKALPVWDPEHLRRALETVAAHERQWLPWLALSAFANIRTGGIARLDWSDIRWQHALLVLPAAKSKIRKRATVRLSPTCLSWLDTFRGATGPVWPERGDHGEFTARLRQDVPYYKNILRRSYGTYLLALTDDEALVASTMNTSVAKLRENYRQIESYAGRLVTKELAEAWFATARVTAENVVQLDLLNPR